jgi:hypothetical protein
MSDRLCLLSRWLSYSPYIGSCPQFSIILKEKWVWWNFRFSLQHVWWYIALCGLVQIYRCFISAHGLHDRLDDGDSMHLWNVSYFLPDYMAQYLRRQSPSKLCFLQVKHTVVLRSDWLHTPLTSMCSTNSCKCQCI